MVSGLKISVLQHTLTHCQYDSLLIILVSEKIPKLSRRQPIRTHQQTMIQVMAQLYNDYFSRIIMPRRSTLTKPWPLFHSFSTERWIHQAMNLNIHVLPRARNDWPLWTSLSESKKRLMVTMTESGTGLCWLQHEFHDHRPDIPPPPVEKGAGRPSGIFVNFHLSISPVVVTAMKILNFCMSIWLYDIFASMIWEDAKRFQFIKPSGLCSGLAMLPLSLVDIPLARPPGVEFFTWVGIIISNLLGSS